MSSWLRPTIRCSRAAEPCALSPVPYARLLSRDHKGEAECCADVWASGSEALLLYRLT